MNKKIHFGKEDIKYIVSIIISSVIYSFSMNTFVHSGNLFPGGYSGISRLLSLLSNEILHFNLSFSVIYFTLNILTTIVIWRRIGHKFVLYSLLWFTLTSFFTGIIPYSEITEDPLLISVFGGLLNGFAMGIALRSNASSGGTDFISIVLSEKLNRPAWNYIFIGNACILVIAGLRYGWNQALYSIIFQYVSKEIVNSMHERYKMTGLQVITNMPDEVSSAVFHTCRHGITKIRCEGEYSHTTHFLLLINVNTYQVDDVLKVIRRTDPHAFISVNRVDKIIGNYYQKPLE